MIAIYKITNKVNGKVYIGQTIKTPRERFLQHIWEAFNVEDNNYFHNAIRKYGAENFTIETLELCERDIASSRESYWILYYSSYLDKNKGYNSTPGGEGCPKYDKDSILLLWNQGKTQKEISLMLGMERHTVSRYLKDLPKEETQKFSFKNSRRREVYMLDKDTNLVINEFPSMGAAANAIGGNSSGISRACDTERVAYGYKWKTKQTYNIKNT